jgi:hypothetical protein
MKSKEVSEDEKPCAFIPRAIDMKTELEEATKALSTPQ